MSGGGSGGLQEATAAARPDPGLHCAARARMAPDGPGTDTVTVTLTILSALQKGGSFLRLRSYREPAHVPRPRAARARASAFPAEDARPLLSGGQSAGCEE